MMLRSFCLITLLTFSFSSCKTTEVGSEFAGGGLTACEEVAKWARGNQKRLELLRDLAKRLWNTKLGKTALATLVAAEHGHTVAAALAYLHRNKNVDLKVEALRDGTIKVSTKGGKEVLYKGDPTVDDPEQERKLAAFLVRVPEFVAEVALIHSNGIAQIEQRLHELRVEGKTNTAEYKEVQAQAKGALRGIRGIYRAVRQTQGNEPSNSYQVYEAYMRILGQNGENMRHLSDSWLISETSKASNGFFKAVPKVKSNTIRSRAVAAYLGSAMTTALEMKYETRTGSRVRNDASRANIAKRIESNARSSALKVGVNHDLVQYEALLEKQSKIFEIADRLSQTKGVSSAEWQALHRDAQELQNELKNNKQALKEKGDLAMLKGNNRRLMDAFLNEVATGNRELQSLLPLLKAREAASRRVSRSREKSIVRQRRLARETRIRNYKEQRARQRK